MAWKIALAGNPNSGKTTLFNALTGSTQYVGNWPGVTVEKKEGKLRGHANVIVADLPGIYSLSPYTLEEVITRNFLLEQAPDVILNIVDATNLERNLYLTTQLCEMGLPVVVALNMMDSVKKSGDVIDAKKLSAELGCPVVEISAAKGQGLDTLIQKVLPDQAKALNAPRAMAYSKAIEEALTAITAQLEANTPHARWLSVKLLERDEKVQQKLKLSAQKISAIEEQAAKVEAAEDDDTQSLVTNDRYGYITKVLKSCYKRARSGKLSGSDRIDKIVTNRFLALPIFFAIMWVVYYVSIQSLGDLTIGWMEWFAGDFLAGSVGGWLENLGAAGWIQSLVVDGIIGGIGSVIVFVPQLMVLFFFISLLEDCGYMARVAFIMDRIFRRFGLSGKSFIPMLIGTGCSVPAIMASRTIENQRDRRMTIILTPFIPCGAKLPVFALFAGALFPDSAWVGPSMYLVGIIMVILVGIVLKRTPLFKGDPAPFVMELPPYRVPRLKGVLIHMWERGREFLIKAGTIIFIACGVIWFLNSFNFSLQLVEQEASMLASIGRFISPIFAPMGFGNWQSVMAAVTGMFAKETVVATFGILFGLGEALEDDPALLGRIAEMFTPVSAYAFMVFTLLAAPCFAAIGATKREMGSWKWLFIAVTLQTGLAYIVATLIYQVGRLLF